MKEWKLISWNVNGIRAALKKGFLDFLAREKPDVLGIQETKIQESQLPDEILSPLDYASYWHCAERKGYSGTAVFYSSAPQTVRSAFKEKILTQEGRMIQMDLDSFTLFNVYFPNGQMSDERLRYKLDFYERSLEYFNRLRNEGRRIVVMGDFNTAHKAIDLKNPESNKDRSGFLPVEREWMDRLVASGYVDTFRLVNQKADQYTWWTYRFSAREKNIGWRIDYFFVSEDLVPNVKKAWISAEVMGSDHCPVGLNLVFPE